MRTPISCKAAAAAVLAAAVSVGCLAVTSPASATTSAGACAQDDYATVVAGQTVSVPVLANDTVEGGIYVWAPPQGDVLPAGVSERWDDATQTVVITTTSAAAVGTDDLPYAVSLLPDGGEVSADIHVDVEAPSPPGTDPSPPSNPVTAPTPVVADVTGPTTLTPGQTATYTAKVTDPDQYNGTLAYEWSDWGGWGHVNADGTYTLTVPADYDWGARDAGSDLVSVSVTSPMATGSGSNSGWVSIVPAMSLAVTAPGTLYAGRSVSLTATQTGGTTGSTTMTWTLGSGHGSCTIKGSGAAMGKGTATIFCPADPGTSKVTYTVHGDDGTGQTATATGTIAVNGADASAITVTPVAATTTMTRATVHVTDTTTRKPVAGARVQTQYRSLLGGGWVTGSTATTDSEGVATPKVDAGSPREYRFALLGTATLAAATSKTIAFDHLPTRVVTQRTNDTVKAHAEVTYKSGNGLTSVGSRVTGPVKMLLQQRVIGGKTWRTLRTVTSNAAGDVTATLAPAKASDFRWVLKATSHYRPSTSAPIRVEHRPTVLVTGGVKGHIWATLKTRVSHQPLAGQHLLLEDRVVGTKTWHADGTYTTGARGRVDVRTGIRGDHAYRWVLRDTAAYWGATSRVTSFARRPATLAVSWAGPHLAVTLTAEKSHQPIKGAPVILERHALGAKTWTPVHTYTTTKTGRVDVTVNGSGYVYRFVAPATDYWFQVSAYAGKH